MESEDENVAAIKGSAMVYCTECGFANEQGNAFCSQCGSPLEQPEANPAAPASPEPPAGRPGVDHTKAVVIVLIALICVVALVIGLFITHSMGLWGAQPQAQTSAQSTGADALDSADDGTTDSSDAKSKAKKNTSDSAKDKNSDDSSKKSSTEKSKPSTPVITSSQLSDIADSYSSSDVAVSAMVIVEHPPTPQRTPPSRPRRSPASNSWLPISICRSILRPRTMAMTTPKRRQTR